MQFLHAPLALLSFAAAAIAQTYIVDAANGPGAHFTEIATAVATVPDGALLEVRAGSYLAFGIANKGLSIRCESGVTVWPSGAVIVAGTAPHQTVKLRGLHKAQGGIDLTSCEGAVLLHDCSFGTATGGTLRATDCTGIVADACTLGNASQAPWEAVRLQDSNAVFTNCTVTSGWAAMDVRSSSVQLVDSAVSASGTVIAYSTIVLSQGSVRIVGGSISAPPLATAIGGTGSARVDPGVIHGQPLFTSTVQGVIVHMPAVVTSGGALGSTVTATMRGPNGDVGALLVGLPGPPLQVPGFADAFWLQPGTQSVCAFTVFSAGVPLAVTYAVPNAPAMFGMQFCWQGASFGTNGLQASNPAVTTHY